jgi:ATP-dependent RNA helicase RhlE
MEGDAVSLVCIDENVLLDDIQSLLRQPIRREVVPGFEVNRSIPREPIRQRSNDVRRPSDGRRAPARQAAPARQMAPIGREMPAPRRQAPEVRPGIGFRQRVPGGYRPAAPSASRQATPSGFNQSAPVTPRRPSGTGFRRPVASDFDRTATNTPRQRAAGGSSIGYSQVRRPQGFGSSSQHGSPSRPAQGERRSGFASLPGERIARHGNRPG